jgi:TfoX/Sxy family transcriptional regulator of competence genes
MATMPRPSEETKELFRAVLPEDERVRAKPMFGQLAGFVNGNMFAGIYGDSVFVRLSEADRAALLREEGAHVFEPMAGRPMKDYAVLPAAWMAEPGRVREWIERALEASAMLPAKLPKPSKPRATQAKR